MSTTRLKKFVVVGFHDQRQAKAALDAAIERFHWGLPHSSELSYLDENIVHFCITDSRYKDAVKHFLLEMDGAQPDGIHHKA